jgi:hypothetical protein
MLMGPALGDLIWNAVKAQSGASYSASEDAQGRATWEAIATVLVTYIQTNAMVLPGTFNVPGAGSVTGLGMIE